MALKKPRQGRHLASHRQPAVVSSCLGYAWGSLVGGAASRRKPQLALRRLAEPSSCETLCPLGGLLCRAPQAVADPDVGFFCVLGVAKAPLPITKAMCKPTPKMKKLVQRRSRIKTFVKIVNYTHVMPTRYELL